MKLDQAQRRTLEQTLADLFNDTAAVRHLLHRAQLPLTRLPNIGATAWLPFWSQVLLVLEQGMVENGLEQLLAEAAAAYPGNAVLRPYAADHHQNVKVLFLASDPYRSDQVRSGAEYCAVRDALQHKPGLSLVYEPAVQLNQLMAVIDRHRPQVLHFSGHGNSQGLLLGDGVKDPETIHGQRLAALLGVLQNAPHPQLRFLLANVCNSQQVAEAAATRLEAAVGFAGRIGDDAVCAFARGCYHAIGQGNNLDNAVQQGRMQMELEQQQGTHQLHLYTRKDVVAGQLVLYSGGRP